MAILANIVADHTAAAIDVASATGFTVLAENASLGHAVENPVFGQVFDGDSVQVAGTSFETREIQLPVLIEASTVAELQSRLDSLDAVLRDASRYGGWLTYESDGSAVQTRYRIAMARRSPASLAEYEAFKRVRVTVALAVDPFGLGAEYGVTDTFSTDTIADGDWVQTYGTAMPTVTGGVAVAPSSGSTRGATHTGSGYSFGDALVSCRMVWDTTIASQKRGGVALKILSDGTSLCARAESDGAGAGTLRISSLDSAGSSTTLTSTAITSLAIGTDYWITLQIVGNVLTASWWTSRPSATGTATHSVSHVLSTANAAIFGSAVRGQCGIHWNTASSNTISFDDFRVEPLTYRSVVFPRVLKLEMASVGTHDALAAVLYTATTTVPSVMLYAWWPAVAVHNLIPSNHGAEEIGTSATVAYGWVATAVSGVISAATSVTRTTTAGRFRTGVAGLEVITPATTDTGASFRIHRRGGFRAGVTYTAQCYVKAVAGTTAVRIKLGVSGDLGTGTASALTSSWVIRTVTWTPAADTDVAYFAVGVNAATATTFQVDDVMVFEGTTAPTYEGGGFGPGIIPAASYDLAKGSLAGGTAWTQTTDADYLVGFGPQASGALSTNGNLEYPILPHLFTPDEYADDEVQLAVFARIEVASTQTSLACAISLAPDRGTSYGVRRYGSFSSVGKTLKLPSSGTVFKPYFLGTITVRVDKSRPRREWLRLAFTNSGGATGTVGVDYLVVVPVRSCARSQSGDSASLVPAFMAITNSTKLIDADGGGAIVEADGVALTPDDGLGGARPRIPRGGCELLVWPSDQVVDLTDSSSASMSETFTGSVVVKATPRYHLLRQA